MKIVRGELGVHRHSGQGDATWSGSMLDRSGLKGFALALIAAVHGGSCALCLYDSAQIHRTRAIRKPRRGAARLLRFCTVSGSSNSLNSLRRGFPVHLSSPVDPAHTRKRPAGRLCFLCPASYDQGRSRMRRVGPALSPYPASAVRARDLAQSVQGPRSWFPA